MAALPGKGVHQVTPLDPSPMTIKLPDHFAIPKDRRKQLVSSSVNTVKAYVDILFKKSAAEVEKEKAGMTSGRRRVLNSNSIVDDYRNSLLHLAVAQWDVNLISILLLKGADPAKPNSAGFTPIDLAFLLKLPSKTIETLLRHQTAVAHSRDRYAAYLDSMKAFYETMHPIIDGTVLNPGDREIEVMGRNTQLKFEYPRNYQPTTRVDIFNATYVDNLLQRVDMVKGSIESTDGYGATALMKACFKNRVLAAEKLLEGGASFDTLDQHGYDALIWACCAGSLECVKLLVSQFESRHGEENRGIWTNKVYSSPSAPEGSLELTPAMAGVLGGSVAIVELFGKLGAKFDIHSRNCSAIKVALVSGRMDLVMLVKKYSEIELPVSLNDNGWLMKSLKEFELGSRTLNNEITALTNIKLPNGTLPSSTAVSLVQKLKTGSSAVDEETKEKELNPLLARWGGRLMVNAVIRLPQTAKSDLMDSIIGDNNEYRDQFMRFFKPTGSTLNQVMMSIVRSIIDLAHAASTKDSAQYVLITGKASQDANELLRQVDSYFSPPEKTQTGQKVNHQYTALSSIFNDSVLFQHVRDLVRRIRNEEVRGLVQATRLAVGAWPPPDAIPSMIRNGIKLGVACQYLVSLANCSGFWPIGRIDLTQYTERGQQKSEATSATEKTSSATSPTTPLSFSEYQRQNESKILNQISSITKSPAAPTGQLMPANRTPTASSIVVETTEQDKGFFESLDRLVRSFVEGVQNLKAALRDTAKSTYASIASGIYLKIDAILEEIRNHYLFRTLEDGFVVDENSPENLPFFKQIAKFRNSLLAAAETVILKSKLASGIWPPPDAAKEMIQSTVPCIIGTKDLVSYVKKACIVIRSTENEERQRMEAYMTDWNHSAQVRDVFNQWEKMQNTSSKDSQEESNQYADLPEEVAKVLEDDQDGLLLETNKDGKEIVKGGRLAKLVEKLADHNYADPEYRNTFLLTHNSFTTSIEFVDLLIKRYDISPPYGLDQRLFETYVKRKIVPVRLRVFNVLKQWMSKYTDDFTNSRELTEKCMKFVREKMSADFGEITVALLESLKRYLAGEVSAVRTVDTSKVPPKVNLPRGVGMEDLYTMLKKSQYSFLEIDPMEFARQLTIADFKIFKEIKATECLDQGWEKKDKLERSPNICKMIKNTNDLTMWVAVSIVHCSDLKMRVNLMKFFVYVAQACRELNNFNAITAFVAGLTMGPVFRMGKMWKLFREKSAKVNELYEELSDVVSAKGQYSRYRSILKTAAPPILPFMGVFLTDLTFVELGNLDYLPELNYINFEKRRKVAAIVSDIQGFQMEDFVLSEVPAIRDFITNLAAAYPDGWPEENAMYAKSLESEPREESDDEDDD